MRKTNTPEYDPLFKKISFRKQVQLFNMYITEMARRGHRITIPNNNAMSVHTASDLQDSKEDV